ncbi:hypothetical protein GCM10017708_19410 [Arthrobacter citreus]
MPDLLYCVSDNRGGCGANQAAGRSFSKCRQLCRERQAAGAGGWDQGSGQPQTPLRFSSADTEPAAHVICRAAEFSTRTLRPGTIRTRTIRPSTVRPGAIRTITIRPGAIRTEGLDNAVSVQGPGTNQLEVFHRP